MLHADIREDKFFTILDGTFTKIDYVSVLKQVSINYKISATYRLSSLNLMPLNPRPIKHSISPGKNA